MRFQAIRAVRTVGAASPAIRGRYSAILVLASIALVPISAGASGVQGTSRQPSAGWVPAGEERLAAIGGAGAATRRTVRSDDGTEIEEYGQIGAQGWRAEYLYVAADGPDTALAGSFDVSRAVSLFRHNAGGAISFGPVVRVERAGGPLFFRRFAGSGEDCYGFEADLATSPQVLSGQPMQLMLGYACRDGAWTLGAQGVEPFLRGVVPVPPVSPDHLVALPPAAGALGFALGQDAPSSGLVAFPLALAERYAGADAELH
jgi:hypothetical protein